MKLVIPVLLLLILSAVPRGYAAFYQWTDDDGVIHLTDSRKKIPKKYQKKAKELNPPGNSAPAAPAASAPKGPEELPPAAAAPPHTGRAPGELVARAVRLFALGTEDAAGGAPLEGGAACGTAAREKDLFQSPGPRSSE